MIQLDGKEGGGQILRSALSLSLSTGEAFHMTNIRGKRHKPGLKRQHLTCVKAALELGGGSADGAELLSEELLFHPGNPKADDYHFKISGAGSAILVAQTLIPALVNLSGKSSLVIEGGTHNPMAPTFDFFENCYLNFLNQMGYEIDATLRQAGFAPAGGGRVEIQVQPKQKIEPLIINQAVKQGEIKATIFHFGLDNVAEKITKLLLKKLPSLEISTVECEKAECRGLTAQLKTAWGEGGAIVTEMVAEFGLSAENLVQKLLKTHEMRSNLQVPVCNRLADQLMLFMAQTSQSEILTGPISNHIKIHWQSMLV